MKVSPEPLRGCCQELRGIEELLGLLDEVKDAVPVMSTNWRITQ